MVNGERGQTFGNFAAAAAVEIARPARIRIRDDDAMRDLPRSPDVLARRPEKRERRRLHRRSDMHGRRIDADEDPRTRSQRGKLG